MGITEKIANAKKTNWLSEGLSETAIKSIVELAKISAQIEKCRRELGMNQKEFAKYMGVSQGMVSKWESREYNFTIKSLNEICSKVNLSLYVSLEKNCMKNDYIILKWDEDKVSKKNKTNSWIKRLKLEEDIA